jgi:hypothetical protein
MKRRVKVWNKIKLYETSAVGIPAYPDAHASVESFSLVKALSNASLKGFVEETEAITTDTIKSLEEENNKETTMEKQSQSVEIAKEEAVVEEVKTEAVAEEPKAEETEKQVDMSETIAKAIKEGIKDTLKELETERGLVAKAEPARVKSLGEIAIEGGLFVKK